MIKKGISILILGSFLLSACGGSKVASDDPKQVTKHDPIELVFYCPFAQDWNEEDFMKTFGEPLKQKFPYITPKYIAGGTKETSVQTLITSGQKIDVIFVSIGATVANLMDNELQYDITPQIKKFNYDLNRLDATMVDTAKKLANGGMYGLPVLVPPSAIYYNKDIFDKFGVAYPKDGQTWDDLYDLTKKLTRSDGDMKYVGVGSSYGHLAVMNQLSLPLVDTVTKRATFNTNDMWKPWVENLQRFYKIPGYDMPANKLSEGSERTRFFKDRTVAMFLALTALHSKVELSDINWDLATFPVFKEKPDTGPQAYPTYFYPTSTNEYKDESFQAIAYLTSDEYQLQQAKAGKFLGVLNNKEIRQAFGKENPMYQGKNVKALQPVKYAPTGSANKYNAIAQSEINVSMRSINAGDTDVNTGIREAAERANKKIDDMEAAAAAAQKK